MEKTLLRCSQRNAVELVAVAKNKYCSINGTGPKNGLTTAYKFK